MAELKDFGFARLHFGRGDDDVPLAVVLCEYEGYPPLPVPQGFDTFSAAMIDRLLGPRPSTDDWFRATFGRGFRLIGDRAWGPVFVPRSFYMTKDANGAETWVDEATRLTFVKQQACFALQENGLVAALDADQNMLIDGDELCLVIFDNGSDIGAMNRGTSLVNMGQPPHVAPSPVAVCGTDCNALTMTHEILHSYGASDLYGSQDNSMLLTVMSATSSADPVTRRNQRRLDPWHEMEFGLTAPSIRDITTPGSLTLTPAHSPDRAARCLLLHDPVRDLDEFFLVQFRTPTADDTDDEHYPAGWAVWQVRINEWRSDYVIEPSSPFTGDFDPSVNHLGSPSMTRGDSTLWAISTPELRWLDGTATGMRLAFSALEATSTAGTVTWELVPESSRFREPLPQPRALQVSTLSTPGLALEYGYEMATWTDDRATLHWAQWLDEVSQVQWGIPTKLTGRVHGSALTRGTMYGLALVVATSSGVVAFCETLGPELLAIPGALTNHAPSVCWHRDRLFVAWQQDGELLLAAFNSTSDKWTTGRVPDSDRLLPGAEVPVQWAAGVERGRISPGTSPSLCSTGEHLYVAWVGHDGGVRFRRCSKGMNWWDRELAPGQPAMVDGRPSVPNGPFIERVRTLPPASVWPELGLHRDLTIATGVSLVAAEVDGEQVALVAFTDADDHINFATTPYPPYEEHGRRIRSSVRSMLPPGMVAEGDRIVVAFQRMTPDRALTFAELSGFDLSMIRFAPAPP